MKKIFGCLFLMMLCCQVNAQIAAWKLSTKKITTTWGEHVDPARVLPEYPRPQMVRGNWQNLNGLWDYAIRPKSSDQPVKYDGKILVPFAVESALSGVEKNVGKDSVLWYNRTVILPKNIQNKTVLLHFGAVDWQAEVFVNGHSAGMHHGGYDPFTFDITPYLKKGAQQLTVKVWDPTDDGPQPRGKQVKSPKGIWYTSVTGIWQTVWLEGVAPSYIINTKQTPDIDLQKLTISAAIANAQPGDQVKFSVADGDKIIAERTVGVAESADLKIADPKLWSPEKPFLYGLTVRLIRNHQTVDQVNSYFAMRKSSIGIDKNGIKRILLNNEFIFQFGPLDQGWWPDGLYTAPSDEALKFDIEQTKLMGFNMIRKHVKVEPARWYYYCDKLGILVWQDMPSGDMGNKWDSRPGVYGKATDQTRTNESEKIYDKEWLNIIDALYNFACINVWTPFNEGWGQFKTEEVTRWTMQKDPSRLVNSASGGNFIYTGPIIDLHNYPEPAMPDASLFGSRQALVLGEFGGLGLAIPGHTWQLQKNWGYQTFTNTTDWINTYASFTEKLKLLIAKGLSAAVYTQTTDVEIEINGLMTYDRKIIKISRDSLKALNSRLYQIKIPVK